MELQHLEVKLPATLGEGFDAATLIPVFHDWIRAQAAASGNGHRDPAPDVLLIDVADYRHVPDGPGVVLIGHEADVALDYAEGRPGLLYRRKAPLPGANSERLAQAVGAAARVALRLAGDDALSGRLSFAADGLEVIVNDRLLAPNSADSAAPLVPELEAWFAGVLGHDDFALVWDSDPRHRFGVTLRAQRPIALEALLARLAG